MRALEAKPARVLVASHQSIVRAGIAVLLTGMGSVRRFLVDLVDTTEDAMEKLIAADELRDAYAVVLLEYGCPGRGGVKGTELMLERWPGLRVIGMSTVGDARYAERMLDAGARGFICLDLGAEMLGTAIGTVLSGKRFLTSEVALELLDRKEGSADHVENQMSRLTAREKEVLEAILAGYRNREIAGRLSISKRTVDKHRQNLKAKLGARTIPELVQAGLRLGLGARVRRISQ
jgi:DNA-binding NarL/FixJ family response regulator